MVNAHQQIYVIETRNDDCDIFLQNTGVPPNSLEDIVINADFEVRILFLSNMLYGVLFYVGLPFCY